MFEPEITAHSVFHAARRGPSTGGNRHGTTTDKRMHHLHCHQGSLAVTGERKRIYAALASARSATLSQGIGAFFIPFRHGLPSGAYGRACLSNNSGRTMQPGLFCAAQSRAVTLTERVFSAAALNRQPNLRIKVLRFSGTATVRAFKKAMRGWAA